MCGDSIFHCFMFVAVALAPAISCDLVLSVATSIEDFSIRSAATASRGVLKRN